MGPERDRRRPPTRSPTRPFSKDRRLDELAARHGVTIATVRNWMNRRRPPAHHHRSGPVPKFDSAKIVALYLEGRTQVEGRPPDRLHTPDRFGLRAPRWRSSARGLRAVRHTTHSRVPSRETQPSRGDSVATRPRQALARCSRR
jgi:hypothetical protein